MHRPSQAAEKTFPGAPRLTCWHVGALVANIEAAIADEIALGAVKISEIARFQNDAFDPVAGCVVSETIDVAFVERGGGRGVLELISPLAEGGIGPQTRLLQQRAGPSHHAYWCENFQEAARWMLSYGAEIVLSIPAGPSGKYVGWKPDSIEELISKSFAAYLRLPGGGIIELNETSAIPYLPAMWGESVTDFLHPPQPAV